MSVSINTQEQIYQKPSTGAILGGVITGGVVSSAVSSPHQFIAPQIAGEMDKLSKGIKKDEFISIKNATEKMVETSGLKASGVELLEATSKNANTVREIMKKEFNKGIAKYLPKEIKDKYGEAFASQILSGNNAAYASESKKIVLPQGKLGLSYFHEVGHAINANKSTFGKILQKSRLATLLMPVIMLIALFKTKKAEGEKPKNKLDQITNFIKENAGKLTFLTFVPVLMEEGLATIRGNKFAKEALSADLAKKVAKSNALGFSTYALMAILSSLGVFLGTKVKDSIAHKKVVNKESATA